jgi:competence protein ComEA
VTRYLAAGIAVALAGVACGVLALRVIDDRGGPAIIIDDPLTDAEIVVAVEGAVATPGVYRLNGDARVQDALDAAGGVTADADLSGINRAARLHDQERLIIPTAVQEGVTDTTENAASRTVPTSTHTNSVSPININTADARTFETLPRIGPTLAARIVAYRNEHGPFRSVDELAQVEGISLDMVDELRPLITV